jgi:hypothetical protein
MLRVEACRLDPQQEQTHDTHNKTHQSVVPVSEVVALKVGDIDSNRMTLRVEQAKGRKDRYAMLCTVLLEHLRAWWRAASVKGKMLDGGLAVPRAEHRLPDDHDSKKEGQMMYLAPLLAFLSLMLVGIDACAAPRPASILKSPINHRGERP